MKTRVIFFGTPDFVIPILKTLTENFQLVGVISTPDTIQGRKKIITPSPISSYVKTHLPKVTLFTPENPKNSAELARTLKSLDPDVAVIAAYGKIIPPEIFDLPRYGSANIHPSLLPKYRGTSPIQTAISNGDSITGVTVIKTDEKMDHGPILDQWEQPISPTDTFVSLHETLFNQSAEKLPSIIEHYINGEIKPQPQNDDEATFCKKITREDGFFSFTSPPSPQELDRMIRAYFPWPTAWTKVGIRNHGEKTLKFLPGERVQMEGGKEMPIKDFVNGYPELREDLMKLF